MDTDTTTDTIDTTTSTATAVISTSIEQKSDPFVVDVSIIDDSFLRHFERLDANLNKVVSYILLSIKSEGFYITVGEECGGYIDSYKNDIICRINLILKSRINFLLCDIQRSEKTGKYWLQFGTTKCLSKTYVDQI